MIKKREVGKNLREIFRDRPRELFNEIPHNTNIILAIQPCQSHILNRTRLFNTLERIFRRQKGMFGF